MIFNLYPTSSLTARLVLVDIGILETSTCPLEWDINHIVLSIPQSSFREEDGFLLGTGITHQQIIHWREDIQTWYAQGMSLFRLRVTHMSTGEVLVTTQGFSECRGTFQGIAEMSLSVDALLDGGE